MGSKRWGPFLQASALLPTALAHDNGGTHAAGGQVAFITMGCRRTFSPELLLLSDLPGGSRLRPRHGGLDRSCSDVEKWGTGDVETASNQGIFLMKLLILIDP